MDRERLLEQVQSLRAEGETIRSIAARLGIHKSRVQRMLKALASRPDATERPLAHVHAARAFVGRHYEMAQLAAAVENALASQGTVVMVVGEPGIGKTRTAQELAAYAAHRGALVLWGRCYETMGTPPYWPWVQAIRTYAQGHEPQQVRSVMGVGAADIAEIVPDLREKMPDVTLPPPLENPAQSRLRLFDSINSIVGKYQVYVVKEPAPPGASTEAVAAAHAVLVRLFPSQATALDARLAASLADIPDGDSKADGISVGESVWPISGSKARWSPGTGSRGLYLPIRSLTWWKMPACSRCST